MNLRVAEHEAHKARVIFFADAFLVVLNLMLRMLVTLRPQCFIFMERNEIEIGLMVCGRLASTICELELLVEWYFEK